MKQSLRRTLLRRRRELSPDERDAAGLAVQQRFLASDRYRRSTVVALYAPIHNEVETGDVARAALSDGKRLIYPAVQGHHLLFREVADVGELVTGAFGILEPPADAPTVLAAEADLIVVPGVAFDEAGRRIGYGKGYYDRALHTLEGSGRLIAFCYDFQLIAEIAGEPHDVLMDAVVTETRLLALS